MTQFLNTQLLNSNRYQISESISEMLVDLGESLVRNETVMDVCPEDRLTLGERLIAIYDTPYVGPSEMRWRAARACAELASRDGRILEAIIKNAELYASTQHSSDADPYSPNSMEVLAEVFPVDARTVAFLRNLLRNDWGVAHFSATQALQAIEKRLQHEMARSAEMPMASCAIGTIASITEGRSPK